MIGVGRMDIPRLAPTGQTRLLHYALHPFVNDLPALPSFALSSSDDSHSRQSRSVALAAPGKGVDRVRFGQSNGDAGNTIAG